MKTKVLSHVDQPGGQNILWWSITNSNDMEIRITNYGATVTNIFVPTSGHQWVDVVLGYDTLEEYKKGTCFFGACVGRFAGYIKEGQVKIGDELYHLDVTDGKNHLHGGIKGFDKQTWDYTLDDTGVTFYRDSLDGEEKYPGNLKVSVRYELSDDNVLKITYDAISDRDTVVNLTNHSYFNLNGEGCGDILNHKLMVAADEYNVNNADGISWLGLLPVSNTPFDFTSAKEIGRDISQDNEQLRFGGNGYDHNMYLGKPGQMKKAAELSSDLTGITLTIYTDQSGIQLYSGNYLEEERGKKGHVYRKNSGVALETQYCADETEMNHGNIYPIIAAGVQYHHVTELRFH